MKEWISSQGIAFYIFTALMVIGVAAAAASNRAYKRLIKEADCMDHADNRLVKYIKLKYSSFYKIGIKPNESRVMVSRYLRKYKIGPFSLGTWAKTGVFMYGCIGAAALVKLLMNLQRGVTLQQMYPMLATAGLAMFVLALQNKLYAFAEKREAFQQIMCDYLENYLKNKMEYGKTLNDKSVQQQAQVAATAIRSEKERVLTKEFSRDYAGSRARMAAEDVDAKVVEDILKEFLN